MMLSQDDALRSTLAHFGLDSSALLAQGGEAHVFRYGASQILRVGREFVTIDMAKRRADLLASLSVHRSGLSFDIPRVEFLVHPFGRVATVEPLFQGITLQQALHSARGSERESILRASFDAAWELSQLSLSKALCSDIYWDPPTQDKSFAHYLEARARRSLAIAGGPFAGLDTTGWAASLGQPERIGFVHFDLYPQNLLVLDQGVSAIVDFGGMCLFGDPRLEPVALAVYLGADTSGAVVPRDLEIARDWLKNHDLLSWWQPAERLLAAIWSFAQDDPMVRCWTRRVLLNEN